MSELSRHACIHSQSYLDICINSCYILHWLHVQLEEDFIQANPDWVAELQIMIATGYKAEIQALSSFGFQYLSQVYLPLKLQEGDWI